MDWAGVKRIVLGMVMVVVIAGCRPDRPAEPDKPAAPPAATPAEEAKPLPPGHPPIKGTDAPSSPSMPPGMSGSGQLPPGHPPMGGGSSPGSMKMPPGMSGSGKMPAGHPPMQGTTPPTMAGRPEATEADGHLTVAGVRFELPENWESQKPSTPMRLAQYELPGEAGPAEMTVFAGIGGSAQANMDRWVAQMRDPANPHDKPVGEQGSFEQGDLKVSTVKAFGTYSPTRMGPMAPPGKPKPDYGVFGIVVEGGPEGIFFFKVIGPKTTIEGLEPGLMGFAQSAEPAAD